MKMFVYRRAFSSFVFIPGYFVTPFFGISLCGALQNFYLHVIDFVSCNYIGVEMEIISNHSDFVIAGADFNVIYSRFGKFRGLFVIIITRNKQKDQYH